MTDERKAKRGLIRAAEPSREDLQALQKTIESVAPKAGAGAWKDALAEILQAIKGYRQSFIYADGESLRRLNLAGDRAALAKVVSTLQASVDALDQLQGSPEAIGLLCRKTTDHTPPGKRMGAPIGALSGTLREWLAAASEAHQEALQRPNRPTDHAPTVLAYSVAKTLKNTLNGELARTTDRVASGARGGAAYAILLRATLDAAGTAAPEDLWPIIDEGLALLEALAPEDAAPTKETGPPK